MIPLPVNELFQTIQGEARWTGTPAVFVRLQGCGVGCVWCDTKHSWNADPAGAVGLDAMLAKQGDSPGFALCEQPALVDLVDGHAARHVVITGGEPCLHDLSYLTGALIRRWRPVQIETSGTSEIRAHPDTWVTLSPKIDMQGGKVVRPDAVQRADEIKIPVGKPEDIARALPVIDARREGVDVWLQPISTNARATSLCIEVATQKGWRVSIQTHKYLGVR
jgi:7-carboxy-7-deazaguanine synthase